MACSGQNVRLIASQAYERSGERPCSDPRDLAAGLGLVVVPSPCDMAYRDGLLLHYPESQTLAQRGPGIYAAVAQLILPAGWNVDTLARELILPRSVARSVPFSRLAAVQPHAPQSLLYEIFASYSSSGTYRVVTT